MIFFRKQNEWNKGFCWIGIDGNVTDPKRKMLFQSDRAMEIQLLCAHLMSNSWKEEYPVESIAGKVSFLSTSINRDLFLGYFKDKNV